MKKTVHTEIKLTRDDSIGSNHFHSEKEIRIYGKRESLSIEFSQESLPQLQQLIHQLNLIEKNLVGELEHNLSKSLEDLRVDSPSRKRSTNRLQSAVIQLPPI